jgi:hypothetical protein
VALVARAREVGLADRVLAAIRDIDYRLRIYPQFGQPLRTLAVDSAELWIGVVDPLVVQYVMDESHRQVMVVRPPTPIAGCGL